MKQKTLFKIISIVSAIALLLGTLGIFSSVFAASIGGPDGLDLQAIVEASDIKVDNSTTKDGLESALKNLSLPMGYSVGSVTEFYKLNAIAGAVEKGSTYQGAKDGEVLVEGENGYVSAAVSLTDGNSSYDTIVLLTITAPMTEFSFASVSSDDEFVYNDAPGTNRWEYRPTGEAAEKIVIPEKVTTLNQNWHKTNASSVNSKTRCIVYNKLITKIPVQGSLGALEVVSIKGDVTEISGSTTLGAFSDCTKLGYIQLPKTIKSIGQRAFYNCSSIKGLYLPEGLETIGKELFSTGKSSDKDHGLTDIVIPTTVTSIGQYAFYRANNDFTVTLLTNAAVSNTSGIHNNAFAKNTSKNVTLRTTKGSPNDKSNLRPSAKAYLGDVMTITEATVRAAKRIEKMQTDVIENAVIAGLNSEEIKAKITASYGSVEDFDASWKDADWSETNSEISNTFVITDGIKGIEIPVTSMKAKEYDLQSVVDAENLTWYNDVTADTLLAELKKLDTGDYEIEKINDFFKIEAIEGAIEVGSTYKGAVDGEILVPGEPGYFTAVVAVKDNVGTKYISALTLEITPTMAEYSFSSVSSEKDFTYNSEAWGLRWEYHPMSGVGAEKIVIPEKVTELKHDWHQSYNYSMNATRCIVYSEQITTIPSLYNFYNVEVVSIRGPVTELTNIKDDGAFDGCSKLKHLRLPDTLKTIERCTFLGCTSLKQLYLPEGLEVIDGELFGSVTDKGKDVPGYNIQKITIPSTVKRIAKNSFVGANLDTEITVLTDAPADDKTGIHTNAFYDANLATLTNKITLRVKEGSGAASDAVKTAAKKKVYINDTIGYVEAAARAKQRSVKINGMEGTAGDFAKMISASYGDASTFAASWESKVWTKNGEYMENKWVISKDGAMFRIPIFGKIVYEDLQAEVDNSPLVCTNASGQKVFEKQLSAVLPSGYNIDKVVQFYKVNAIDGAVDAANGDVLVEGHIGSVEAVVDVTRPDGKVETLYVHEIIEPNMAEYNFASVSANTDFVIENGQLKSYSGTAEKVVIPEGVTGIAENWLSGIAAKQSDYNNNDTTIKCIVYPESLEGTIPDQNNLKALEVVSFKGDKVTGLATKAFFGAENLKYIGLPDDIKTISNMALATGEALKGIYLPDGLETIGDNAFSWNSGSDYIRHGLVEITIPESVTAIGKNAFAYANSIMGRDTFTVTVLNKDTAYADGMFAAGSAKVTVRVFAKSGIYNELKNNNAYTLYKLDDMKLVEAAARVIVKHDDYSKNIYSTDITSQKVAADLAKAYASHSSFTYDWNNSWDTTTDAKRYGTITYTDGKYSIAVSVNIDIPPVVTLKQLVDAVEELLAEETFVNADTQDSFKLQIEAKIPGKYKIEIVEFNMQRAVDGAADDTEILVAGHNGAIASVVKVTDYYGASETVMGISKVLPTIEKYSFTSVSRPEDFVLSTDGKVVLEYYGTAQKVVIPDGVERIANDWMWRRPTNVKAVVFPESLKSIGDNFGSGMAALEVVSMKDNVVSVGKSTFSQCYSLKYIHISENLQEISESMFYRTYSLIDLRIPESVEIIRKNAFNSSALRKITLPAGVRYIEANAFTNPILSEKQISTSKYPVSDLVRFDVYDWMAANEISERPCEITVLCKDTEIDANNFVFTDATTTPYVINAYNESNTYKLVSNLLALTAKSEEKWTLNTLDKVDLDPDDDIIDSLGMSYLEALARASIAADSLKLYNDMSADDVMGILKDAVVLEDEANSVSWSKALNITKATSKKNGSAKGTLKLALDGKSFEISVNSTVYEMRPEISDDEFDDFWDDNWDDDLWEDEDLEDIVDDFIDDEIIEDILDDEFEDDLSDELVEDEIVDDEPIEDIPEDTPETEDDKKPSASDKSEENNEFPLIWVIVGSGAALLLLIVIILVIIILKKNKK